MSYYPSTEETDNWFNSLTSDELDNQIDSLQSWYKSDKTVVAVYSSSMPDNEPVPARIYRLIADIADVLNLPIRHDSGSIEVKRPLTRKELEENVKTAWRSNRADEARRAEEAEKDRTDNV